MNKWVIAAIVIVLLAVAAWFVFGQQPASDSSMESSETMMEDTSGDAMMEETTDDAMSGDDAMMEDHSTMEDEAMMEETSPTGY